MAIIKTLKESKILAKGRPRQTIYPVTSSDAVIVPNKGILTTVLSKVAFSNDYNDLDNIPTNISAFNNDVGYLTSFTETDPTVPLWAKQNTKPSYNYNEILNTPILATVATSGNYNDLINKPTIPTVPTNVSAFTNDVGYLTQHQSLADYYTKTEVDTVLGGKADSADLASVATSGSYNDLSNKPTIPTVPSNVSAFNNDAGYLTTESDPTVPNHVKSITQQNITNWNNKADVFTINCVYNGTSITSCDKTFAEISSAHNSGKILNVVINNGYAFGRLNQVNGSAFYFNVVDTVDDHIIESYELEINSNNTCNITLASINIANYYTKNEMDSALDDKQDTIADLATIRNGASLGATAYQKPNGGIPKSDLASSVQTSLGKADTALQQHQDLSSYADGAEYDSTNHLIYLKHGNTRLSNPINANDFIKDGMVDTVEVTGGNLVITFNTDSGKEDIEIPISDIFDASNYYTKSEVDTKTAKTTARGDSKLLYNGQSVEAAISNVGFSTTNNLLNNGYNMAIRSNSTNPFFGLKEGSNLWYAQAAGNYFYFGPTSTNAMRLDQSGNVVVQTGSLTANSIIKKNGTSSQFLKADGSVDSNTYLTSFTEIDPTVPSWAKQSTKPTYTASEVGALPSTTFIPSKTSDLTNDSGFITGYTETDPIYSASVAAGITSSDISNWNSKTSNIGTITGITMNGVSKGTSGVVNLGTVVTSETDPTVPAWAKAANKPTYTASEVGALPSTTQIPSKTSDLTNDSGFITGYTETDPTVPSWAKQSTKPSYTASEVGALPDTTVIPSKTSDLTNDSGFVTGSKMYIGTCATAAATNPKECTVETFPLSNGEPLDGTMVCVKFSATDTSTSTSPTLNVNNTGAKRIWYNNALLAAAKSSLHHGYANRYIYYVYDSSLDSGNGAWVWLGCGYDSNTTYSNASLGQGYAEDTRSSAVAAVTATISSYALTVGGVVSIHFAYDVPANATLNIRSRGAKAIYYKNAPITAGVIKAGDTATFIYTTYYHLISIDRSEGADLTNYYTKSEVDTALSGKQATLVSGTNLKTINNTSLLGSGNVSVQPTLVSGTNIKTINNESLLGSGNITIEGGGSSMSITYNASTQALIIGSGSVNTYTITFDAASLSDGFSVQINGGESIINQSPISVNEGDSVNVYCMTKTRPTATMGGESIVVYSEGPETFYFTIESVTGDIVVSV